MPLKYDFALREYKLRRWRRKSFSLVDSDLTLKKRIEICYKTFNGNPSLFFPSSFVILTTLILQIVSLYPSYIIKKLETVHNQFKSIESEISNINKRKSNIKSDLTTIKSFYNNSSPLYLFSFYLQNTIPLGVNLSEFSVNNKEFYMVADSQSIQGINEMITLLIESPIINPQTIKLKELKRESSNKTNSLTKQSKITAQLNGKINKITLKDKELLYSESAAHGLLRKILRINALSLLIK